MTAFTNAHHLSQSWARSVQSMSLHPTSRRSISILSSHHAWCLSRGLFPSGIPTKTLYSRLLFPIRAACRAHYHSYKQNTYGSSDTSFARPGRKQANVSVRIAWISFRAMSCRKKNLMSARVSMLLKSRASLTCFWACFLPGRAKDLSAPRYQTVTVRCTCLPSARCAPLLVLTKHRHIFHSGHLDNHQQSHHVSCSCNMNVIVHRHIKRS